MESVRVVNLSPERIRYEEEQKRLVEIDETLQRLAQKAEVLQVVKILISKDPASIPCLSENLKSKYPDFPSALSSQALEIAIKRVESDQNHLLQERAFIMAPLTELPEDLLKHITDLASPEEKATLSQVSRSWNKRSVASLQHEYDRFIQHKICQYIETLAPDATKPPFHSSPSTLAAVRADLEHIMDDHCSMGVQSLKNLRERVFELRNRARVALSHLDPADFQRIPSTPAPIGITRSDRYNLLPDLPFDAFYLMQDLLLCYDPAGEIDETIRFKTAGRLIKQGDVVTAREVARNVVTNESLIQETFCLLVGAGDIDGALALVDRFHQSYNKDLALLSIAMSIAKRGDIARARAFLDLISREEKKNDLLVKIAEILAEKEDVEGALQLAWSIVEPYKKDSALLKICAALAKVGRIEQALQVSREIDSQSTVASAIGDIVEAVLKIKDFDRALAYARMVPNDAPHYRSNPFSLIADEIARSGNIDRALEIITLMPPDQRQYGLSGLIPVIGTLGQVERAFGLISSLHPNQREFALERLVIALADNGDVENASHVASLIPPTSIVKVSCMCHVAEAIAKKGAIDQALDILNPLFSKGSLSDKPIISMTFSRIALMPVEAQDIDLALRIVKLIPFRKDDILYKIVALVAKSGDTQRARMVAEMIEDKRVVQKDALQCIGYWEEKLALHNSKG